MNPNRSQGLEFPLAEVKKVVHKWLLMSDDTVVDVILATHVANQFATDPTWTLIIGPPSHTKTELLRALDGYPEAIFVSNLTPSTLVSGILPKKGQPDPSLLLQLDGKTVVLKDFTTILSMRSENQQEIISQLREVYDGQYTKIFGNGKSVNWHGHVGLLGACTPVYDKHYGVIGSLGDRFLLYRTGSSDPEAMGFQAQKIVGRENVMREEIMTAFQKFLDQFKNLENLNFKTDERSNQQIVSLACFCSYARCPVDRSYRDGNVEYTPLPEGTPRLVKQFMQLGMALVLVHGKDRIDGSVYEVVKKVGRDLLSDRRLRIIRHLWENGYTQTSGLWTKTSDIAEELNIPTNTTKITCEDLMIVGVLQRSRDGEKETSPYRWRLTQYILDCIKGAELFEVTTNEPF